MVGFPPLRSFKDMSQLFIKLAGKLFKIFERGEIIDMFEERPR
jgi:hypothetical protein